MDNFQKVNEKLIEFIDLIHDDGKNMSLIERCYDYWSRPMENKPEIKKRKNCLTNPKFLN